MSSKLLVAVLIVLLIWLASAPVMAVECTAKFKLNLNYMNKTTKAGNPATCSDGTPGTYFIDLPDTTTTPFPYKWIIYLGDGDTCDEAECNDLCELSTTKPGGICEGVSDAFDDLVDSGVGQISESVLKCYFARVQCSSKYLDGTKALTPQSILCREIDYFKSFARVFVPLCTLDWWLGRGSVKNVTSTRFRGAFIIDILLETLDALHGISASPLVVLSGTRGGGVGALHSVKYVREKLNGPEVIVLADSSWFVDTESFAPKTDKTKDIFLIDSTLEKDTKEWIDFARMNEDCDLVWNVGGPGVAARHRCMIVPELVPFLAAEKIMFIHSQYDLFFLSQQGLLDETAADRFFDTQSFALRAISYVESFGSVVRSSTLDAATIGPDNHYFYMPSCGTHSFIVPTSLHIVREQTRKVATAGSIRLTRDVATWEQTAVGDLAVVDAVGRWISNRGNAPVFPSSGQIGDGLDVGVAQDLCKGFLCNPTCSESILPFRVISVFGPCGQNIILAYAILMMVTLWLAFAWGYFRVRLFRYRARQYWHAFKTGKPLPDFGYYQRRLNMIKIGNNNTGMSQEEINYLRPVSPKTPTGADSTNQAVVPPMSTQSGSFAHSSNPGYSGPASAPLSPIPGSPVSTASVFSSPQVPQRTATVASTSPAPPKHVVDEEDGIDLVALAEALTSKDKATRLAAKKAYKEHQKRAAQRRKDAQKTAEQLEYAEREREAKRLFEERQAALGLAAQQAKQAEEEAKAKKKVQKATKKKVEGAAVEDVPDSPPSPEPSMPAPVVEAYIPNASGKIQKKAEDELLLEAASNDYRKVHLMVRDLSYWAPPRTSGNIISRLFRRKGSSKYQILKNIDLAVKPANVHALMGPSGSGKSTLLDVLALIRDSGEMMGSHYINGVRSDSAKAHFLKDWLRHNISYVRQTDVLFPRMTVREHLQHAAWLLLPQFMPDAKKLRRVQQVIELLELDSCAETICGDGGIKIEGGISGGQRRRVSVATQLLRLPACLLLDEPTTGLDSTNALLLVKSLHTLAHRGGLTVVMTIHQPRNEIFNLFDQLTVLAGGKIVFSGMPREVSGHFSLDMSERQDLSVANALLDKLADSSENEIRGYEALYSTGVLGRRVAEEMKAEATDFDDQMAQDLQEVLREQALGEGRWSWESPSSSAMQMWVLMSRTMRRGGFDLRKSGFLAIIGGCVVGLCFLGVNTVTSRVALCYLCVATMTFLQGAFLGDRYLAEKQMYDHESSAGSAVQWTAFLASQFVRDSVTSACEAIGFGVPVFWIGGMFPEIQRFIIFLILIVLIAHVCISSNVAVEIDRDNLRAAALVNVAYVGLGALFNGFIIQIRDLPVYLSWLPYIMVTYWGFAGILVNDFTGDTFDCKASVLECATRTGDVVIVSFSFDHIDPYVTMLACIIMTAFFRGCAVVDFYARYVRGRGSGLKLLAGGSSLEDDVAKVAPRRAVFANTANKLGGAMKAMISSRGDAGRRMVEQAKKKNQDDTQRVIEAGGGAGLAFNEEWDQVADDRANNYRVAAKEPFYRRVLLSRQINIVLVLFDIGFLGVICALTVGDYTLFYFFLAVTSIIGIFFALQFVVSMCFLIPMTPAGPKDCTWAGTNDGVAFLATVADFVLMIQIWTGNAFAPASSTEAQVNNATTFFILAGLCRLTRLVRVYNFWFKIARYHEIRAISWLLFADEEKEKKMDELEKKIKGHSLAHHGVTPVNATVKGEPRVSNTNKHRSMNVKSVRLAANPMWSSYANTGGVVATLAAPPKIDPSTF